MKKILSLILLCLWSMALQAADYEAKRYWSKEPLTMSDFRGKKTDRDTTEFKLRYRFETALATQREGLDIFNYYRCNLYMDQYTSWISPEAQSHNGLRLCQIGFDMLEVYRRKIALALSKYSFSQQNEVIRVYQKNFDEWFEGMKLDTRYGTDTTKIKIYESLVIIEMQNQPDFDPSQVRLGQCEVNYFVAAGACGLWSDNNYFDDTPVGVSLSYYIRNGVNPFLFYIDLSSSFSGEAKKDMKSHEGHIEQGEETTFFRFMLNYGHRLNHRFGNQNIYATGGLGVMQHTANANKAQGKEGRTKGGLCLGAGVLYETSIWRRTRISCDKFKSASQEYVGLLIKPSIYVAKYHNQPLFPSAEISVSLTLGRKDYYKTR